MAQDVKLDKGDTLNVFLPSGIQIQIEVTGDTASICKEDRILYSEQLLFDGSEKWEQDWPTTESGVSYKEDPSESHMDTMMQIRGYSYKLTPSNNSFAPLYAKRIEDVANLLRNYQDNRFTITVL